MWFKKQTSKVVGVISVSSDRKSITVKNINDEADDKDKTRNKGKE
jgi:hypothetical protein